MKKVYLLAALLLIPVVCMAGCKKKATVVPAPVVAVEVKATAPEVKVAIPEVKAPVALDNTTVSGTAPATK